MTPDPEDRLQQLRATHQHTVDSLKSTLERLEARVEERRRERDRPAAPALNHTLPPQRLGSSFREPKTWLAIVVLISLGLYVNYVRLQVAAANEALAEIRKQSNSIAATAAAAKRSADIAFLQLKNTNAADLHFTTGFARDHGSVGVWLNIDNTGHAMATKIHGTETVSIEELPSRQKIQPDVVLELDSEKAKPLTRGQPVAFRKVYAVSGLDANAIRDIMRFKKVVRIEGAYTWDDGFGDTIASHFCWDYIATSPQPDESASYGQYDCDSSENRVKQAIRERQVADAQPSQ